MKTSNQQPTDATQTMTSKPKRLLDKTITLRQIRNWLILLAVLGSIWYVWQFFKLEWHSKMGGLPAKSSPYYDEIPDDCRTFSDRHAWTTNFSDSKYLRIRGLRLKEQYMHPAHGSIRCLGYAVLTGVHMRDPLDANFVNTYVDDQGDPIVRITVDYLKTYQYDLSQRKEPKTEEKK